MHPEITSILKKAAETSLTVSEIYEFWWSGEIGDAIAESLDVSFHEAIPANAVGSLGSTTLCSIGELVVPVSPGEFLLEFDSTVRILRRSTWHTKAWNWWQTSWLHPISSNNHMMRIYVPSRSEEPTQIGWKYFEALEEAGHVVTLKARRHYGTFRDSIVIWVFVAELLPVLEILKRVNASSDTRSNPPPLAFMFDDFGLTDHPEDGSSVGWMFSESIWEFSKVQKHVDAEVFFSRKGLSTSHPWRLNPQTIGLNDWDMWLT